MLLFSVAVILLMCALSAWAWHQIPDDARIPTHWNAKGEANGYSTKNTGLFLMPGMMAGLSLLLALFPAITPRREHLLQSMRVYNLLWSAILLFFLMLHFAMVLIALGKPVPMAGVVQIGIGVLFVVSGNWMGKVRSNFIMGVRTPWTLSSELSWNKTHRLAGKLFVGVGLAMILAGIFFSTHPAAAKILIYGLIGLVLVPVAYSWWIWKNDSDRHG